MEALTLRQFRQSAQESLLERYPGPEVSAQLRWWLARRLQLAPHELAMAGERILQGVEQQQLKQDLQRLAAGEPLAYVLQEATFRNLLLWVTPAVLIPRPETEELVEAVLQLGDQLSWEVGEKEPRPLRALDLGTGSGCIPLALKQERPQWEVEGADISPEALAVAQENARRLGLKVPFRPMDLFAPPDAPAPWDLLVSNPPYIPPQEASSLEQHVLAWEPELALFTPGADPLAPYRALAHWAKTALAPGGWLAAEVHAPLGEQVVGTWKAAGLQQATLRNDLQQRPRMAFGRKPQA